MNSDPATVKFEQALPFALLSVSPQLAALHTARTRTKTQASCTRCGADLTLCTRFVRSKRQNARPTRALSTTCNACSAVTSTPIQPRNVSSFSSRKPKALTLQEPPIVPTSLLSSDQPQFDANTLPSSTKSAVSLETRTLGQGAPFDAKKKSGLQQMLQRNREKKKTKSKAAEVKPTGLSAFLSTL